MSIIKVLIYKDFSQLRIIYILLTFFFLDYFLGQILSRRERAARRFPGRRGGGQKFGRKGEGPPYISTPLPYDTGSCGRDKN